MSYYLVPVDGGAEAVVAAPMIIGGVIGAGYTFMHNGDWASGGLFVGALTLSIFGHIADWINNIAPGSAIVLISDIVLILGFVAALYLGLGGFIGGFLAWMIMDIFHHLNVAH